MNAISSTENHLLLKKSREALRGRWGTAVGITAVLFAILLASNTIPDAGWLISLLVTGPLVLGYSLFSLAASSGRAVEIGQLFQGFRKFGASLGLYLLTTLFTVLWALLLIIPGVIAAYSYALSFYILSENESIGPMEAIRRSKEMMRGNKGKLFKMHVRFLGWALLSVLSAGIGFLWLVPYVATANASFYRDLKAAAENSD
jgi:uncharacterized membrane protein